MTETSGRKAFADIMEILIDIFNLAEQLGVYFIAKQNDLDESKQQLFFFILFGVGGASVFKPLFTHPIAIALFSIGIEVGELVSYLMLLINTTSLLVVAILFFCLEVILHIFSLYGQLCHEKEYCEDFAKDLCTLPARVLIYGLLFETPILFLFLDPTSSFRDTFYEVLLIFSTFFGAALVEVLARRCCGRAEKESSIHSAWQGFLSLLNAIVGPIITITAVVYAIQAIQHKDHLKTYDFVIYIIILISYGGALLSTAIALLCSLCLCARALFAAIMRCFRR